MRDFSFWQGEIYNAKTTLILKSVGEDLAQFQNQTKLFGDEEKKLTDDQVATLRKMYSEKMKKLTAETIQVQGSNKPEFKK